MNDLTKHPWSEDEGNLSRFIGDNWYFLKGAVKHTVEHLFATLFIWLLIGLSLAIPSAFWLMYDGLDKLQANWIEDTGFNVFLTPDLDDDAMRHALEEIQDHHLVDSVELIIPEEAMREFLSNSNLPINMTELEFESLPASVAVMLESGAQSSQILQLIDSLGKMNSVAEVRYEETWTARFTSLKELLFRLVWFFVVVFGASSVLVIAAAVRLAIDSRLEEVKLMHLLGSPNHLVQGIFNYCGLVYGIGGALSAAMVLALAVQLVEEPLNNLVATYGYSAVTIGYDYKLVVSLLVIGAFAGIASALIITWKRMRHLSRDIAA